jgi:DNA-binding CsgD family transcriptional regulator
MRLHGAWEDALDEARRAEGRCLRGENPGAAGEACYERGEILRLRGDFGAAERAYREASGHGREPQPGLALMRLAQGKADAAAAAIRRISEETSEADQRAGMLPAYVEIVLAVDDLEGARRACDELDRLAEGRHGGALEAMAARTRGALELAAGDAHAALPPLRRASRIWHELEAPYETARVRELVGHVCRELGDEEAAALELEAARDAFARLGAATDLARVGLLAEIPGSAGAHGLTRRELEVLRHLAAGETNKAIASELVLSVRTVDRHVSNIYAKLGVSSRAAATAYAHERGLL